MARIAVFAALLVAAAGCVPEVAVRIVDSASHALHALPPAATHLTHGVCFLVRERDDGGDWVWRGRCVTRADVDAALARLR